MPRKATKPALSKAETARLDSLISDRLKARGKTASRISARISAIREDGWENELTGVGVYGRDKTASTTFCRKAPLPYPTLSSLFHGDDLAYTICSERAYMAMRQGVDFSRKADEKPAKDKPVPGAGAPKLTLDAFPPAKPAPGAPPPPPAPGMPGSGLPPLPKPDVGPSPDAELATEQATQLRRELVRQGVLTKVFEAATYGQAFGAGALILGLPGAPESKAPEDASKLQFLTVVDRSEIRPVKWYDDPFDANFGKPELYALTPKSPGGAIKPNAVLRTIHESRLVVFGGVLTTREVRQSNEGWDLSILDRVVNVLQSLNTVLKSTEYMTSDVSQSVLRTPRLLAAIGQVGLEAISERVALLDQTRSVARTLLLDKDEEFSHQERGALAWLADTIDKFFLRLASAARMPVTIMMGQAPAGLNATGAIDLQWWYDQVQAYRVQELEPRLQRIVAVISRGLFPDLDPETWEIKWPSLWQLSPEQDATRRKTIAETDKVYIDAGVVMPEEVTRTRWGSGKFNPGDYQIDLEARQRSLEMEAELALRMPDPDPSGGEGDDPPAPGAPGKDGVQPKASAPEAPEKPE